MKLLEKLSYVGFVLPTFSSAWDSGGDFFDSVAKPGLRVSMYRCLPVNEQILQQWTDMSRSISVGGVFQSPAWQGALARPFVRAGRYRLLAVHHGRALRAILPLQVGAGGVLESPGEMISDYLEPLVERIDQEDSWALMLGLLQAQCAHENTSVVLHNVPADAPCRSIITAIAHDCGFDLQDETSACAARITLPKTWDEYLATLGGRDRKELKRKLKHATNDMGAALRVVTSEPEIHDELQRALQFVERAGGSRGVKARWTYRPIFKRAAAQLAGAGQLQAYTLLLKDKPSASLITFPSATGPLAWAAGFDAEMSKWSPGIVLFAMAIKHSIETGAKYFDLLRGQARYKNELGAGEFPLRRLTLKPAA